MANQVHETELENRRKIFKRKLTIFVALILLAILSFFAAGFVPPALIEAGVSERVAKNIQLVFRGIHIFGSMIGVFGFAKTMHDPLTPKEAEELEKREIAEKTGNKEES